MYYGTGDAAILREIPSPAVCKILHFTVNLHVNVNVKWFRHFPVKSQSLQPYSCKNHIIPNRHTPTTISSLSRVQARSEVRLKEVHRTIHAHKHTVVQDSPRFPLKLSLIHI